MSSQPAFPGSSFEDLPVCIAGIALSGRAVAEALLDRGARVTVVDDQDGKPQRAAADELRARGATVVLGRPDLPESALLADARLVITSPGWRPGAPLLAAASKAGVPVFGDVEFAWRLRGPRSAPWLAITGTNGKTTAVRMLTSMLVAGGRRTIAAGNVGTPLPAAVLADPPYDVIAVELSSFQLHWSSSLAPAAAAILNVAPDHLDWHGSMESYAAAKARIFGPGTRPVFNADDPWSVRLSEGHPGAVSFTLGPPGHGQLGVQGESLVDRAFSVPAGRPVELATFADIRPFAPHNVANALAAAALARAHGLDPAAIRTGLAAFQPDPHRIARVANFGEVDFVDDSKATNPHAAAASLAACRSAVWIAGGLAKGASFDELVAASAHRLRGVVLLGADRAVIGEALARHAPDVPVVELSEADTDVMDSVVRAAARLAQPGDTVLLAPACASMDMFASYGERGDRFAEAVRRFGGVREPTG